MRMRMVVLLALSSAGAAAAAAHEPIHGLGPDMPARGLFGYELEVEHQLGSERESVLVQELLYGVTPNFAVTFSLPWMRIQGEGGGSDGLGDMRLRAKWRFLRRDYPGGSDQVAAVVGLRVPTGGRHSGATGIDAGTWGGLLALTATRSGERWYLWGDVQAEIGGRESANERLYGADVALGFRPRLAEFDELDPNPVLELNLRHTDSRSAAGGVEGGGDPTALFLSPGLLLAYRRYLVKAGLQVPIHEALAAGDDAGIGWIAAFEIHF